MDCAGGGWATITKKHSPLPPSKVPGGLWVPNGPRRAIPHAHSCDSITRVLHLLSLTCTWYQLKSQLTQQIPMDQAPCNLTGLAILQPLSTRLRVSGKPRRLSAIGRPLNFARVHTTSKNIPRYLDVAVSGMS